MEPSVIIVMVVFAAMLIITVVGAVQAHRGNIGISNYLGFRTGVAKSTEESWYAVQKRGWYVHLLMVPIYVAGLIALIVNRREPDHILAIVIPVSTLEILVCMFAASQGNRRGRGVGHSITE